jgi:sugar phosphate isomerase/epimerase
MQNDEQSVRNAMVYGKDIGVPTVVCSPHPDSMPILDRMVKEYDMRLAIHNHGPGDKRFPTPYDVWNAVHRYDARIGLCIDVGHAGRSGLDPAQAILKLRSRVYDIHIKDIDRTIAEGVTVEGGRGALDLGSIVRSLQTIGYSHIVSIEYEKDGDDPLPGLAETTGYLHGLIAAGRKAKA